MIDPTQINIPPVTAPHGGIYLHIPFCRTKCHYCDFYSITDRDDAMDRFVACLVDDITSAGDQERSWVADTVYIGGGTPSLLRVDHLEKIIRALDDTMGLGEVVEFTMEANPGEASADKLKAIRQLGVNRLSMGFQSFNAQLLQFLGRMHTSQQGHITFDAARAAGFENISADVIFNIPGQSLDQWQHDLSELVAMAPEHISAYSLTVEPGTGLNKAVEAGEITILPEETDIAMLELVRQYLPDNGYAGYEVSNYAPPGRECRHNMHYWRIEPYLAFGPSAHGFDGQRRFWNVRSLDAYMERLGKGQSPWAGSEPVTPENLFNERMAFGLRIAEGIDIQKGLGFDSPQAFSSHYQWQLDKWAGQIVIEDGRLKTTTAGLLLIDSITADFIH